MDQISGRRIANRYEMGDFLAKGGMGAVYRGRDLYTGQIVAIKHLLQANISEGAALIDRFVREGDALRMLAHPNIVSMLAAVEEAGEYYLVMDYVSGGSLADLLNKQPQLPVDRVLQIGLDISDALTRAHRLRIIHRDLKPANILLDATGIPRLTDFGVARIDTAEQATKTGTILGTLAYLPPEALNGEGFDARGDIWAFGVVLFEMLAGGRPFQGEPLSALIVAILTARVPDLESLRPDAPVALVDLIYRMLDKDKNGRISSMRQVGAELETILSNSSRQSVSATRLITVPVAISDVGDQLLSNHSRTPTSTPGVTPSPNNLPVQTTPFIGREDECAELANLLDDPGIHLITILGPGGIGKTRLSIEVAVGQRGKFADGVFFVSLAPLVAVELLVSTIAEAVRFQFYEGSTAHAQLLDFFREKELLLVLDNFEHLIEGADLVSDILQVAPDMTIIATSRERLNLQAETLFRLEGMDFPEWETPDDALEYSAVKLFVQSAKRALPGFSLTSEQLPYVARICRLVRGLPLGIVLAAAWVDALSLAEISDEIARSLDFLTTDARDVPSRQRSLQAVFDYSWALLKPGEQRIFSALSVFRGGFDREAAQNITDASLINLTNLVNKSLLRRAPDGRYEVHELLRQYAAIKLQSEPQQETAARKGHSEYYSALVQKQTPRLINREQAEAIATMEVEMDNIGVAWEFSIAQENLKTLQMTWEGLILFYLRYSQNETSLRLFQMTADSLRNVPAGNAPSIDLIHGVMLGACGFFKAYIGQRDQAVQDFSDAERLLLSVGKTRELALISVFRVLPKMLIGEPLGESNQQSFERLQFALKIAEEIDDQWLIATIYSMLAWVYNNLGQYQLGIKFTEDSLTMMRVTGDEIGQIGGLYGLGWGAVYRGDYQAARHYFENVSETHRKLHAWRPLGYALLSLSEVGLLTAELTAARAYISEATEYFKRVGDRRGVIIALSNLARLVEREGKPDESLQLFEETVIKSRALGNSALLAESLNELARIEGAFGHQDDARRHWLEALQLAREGELIRVTLDVLIGLSRLYTQVEQTARAVTLLSFVQAHPAASAEAREHVQSQLEALHGQLSPDEFVAAQQAGQSCDLNAIVVSSLAG